MIADLDKVSVFETKIEPAPATAKTKNTILVSIGIKLRQFSQWFNPKNWFSRFAEIEITLEEFACKKKDKG